MLRLWGLKENKGLCLKSEIDSVQVANSSLFAICILIKLFKTIV